MVPPFVRRKLTPFAVSMELPPPKPMSESMPASAATARPRSIIRLSGFSLKSLNVATSIPEARRIPRARSTCGVAMSPGSATKSVRRKPSSLASSPSRVSAPTPNTRRGFGSNSKLFTLRESEELVAARDEQRSVRGDHAAVDRASHVRLRDHRFLFSRLQHYHVAVLVAQIDLPVDDHGG